MTDRYTRYLSAFLDDDLPRELRSALLRHLAQCYECRAALSDIREIIRCARDLFAPPSTPDLWPDVVAALRRGRSEPSDHVGRQDARVDSAFNVKGWDENRLA